MLDDTERDGMVICINHLFSKEGPVWCVVKTKEIKSLAADDLRTVGDIVFIAKTEAGAKRQKRKRARGAYVVQLMWLSR